MMSENDVATLYEESLPCQLCGSDQPQLIFMTKDLWEDTDPAMKKIYNFVQCPNCELMYLPPRVRAEYIAEYYRDDYPSPVKKSDPKPTSKPTGLKGILSPKIRQTRQQVFEKLRGTSQIKPSLSFIEKILFQSAPLTFSGRGLKLLDVGCGTGYNLMERHKLGWDVYGIEPSERAVQICQAYGLNVQQGLLEAGKWDENEFDVVTLYQVVEHLPYLQYSSMLTYRLKPFFWP